MYDTMNLNITLARQRQDELLSAARSTRSGQSNPSRRSPVLLALGRGLTKLGTRLVTDNASESANYELQTNRA